MDRLRTETGADPMPDPIAELPGDEQDETITPTPTPEEAGSGRPVPPDPEDDLVAGDAPEDPRRLTG